MAYKKLYRSRENAMVGGVCAGLAEYFNIDPSLARLATVLLVFPGGLSFWAYIVAWIIIPQKPLEGVGEIDTSASQGEINQPADDTQIDEEEKTDKTKLIAGVVLIALGAFFLLNTLNIFVWFSFFKLWPVVLIVIGAVILLKGLNRGEHDES